MDRPRPAQAGPRCRLETILETENWPMMRTAVALGTLLLGVSAVMAQQAQDQVAKTQLAMKSNLASAIALSDMAKGKKPYDQAAVDKALADLEDVAKRFPSLFPDSIKGLKPGGEYYASPKVWTERADFEAHAATFVKAIGEAKTKFKSSAGLKAEYPTLNNVCLGCHEKFRLKG
jgi:cytochrome c556